MDEVFALAGRIYAEYCGAAKFVASYDAMLDWVATLPDLVLPSRFETEDVRADGTVVTRHEIVLVSVRLADGPRLVEMDGTSITMTPQIARMRQRTYEVALTGTYVYRRTRGVPSAYLSATDAQASYGRSDQGELTIGQVPYSLKYFVSDSGVLSVYVFLLGSVLSSFTSNCTPQWK
jgi:hypothetical protein